MTDVYAVAKHDKSRKQTSKEHRAECKWTHTLTIQQSKTTVMKLVR